jgi:hypothetical protein
MEDGRSRRPQYLRPVTKIRMVWSEHSDAPPFEKSGGWRQDRLPTEIGVTVSDVRARAKIIPQEIFHGDASCGERFVSCPAGEVCDAIKIKFYSP